MRRTVKQGNSRRRVGNGLVEETFDILIPGRDTEENAKNVSKGFHGREVQEIFDIESEYRYPKNLAEIGKLVELMVANLDQALCVPISFDYDKPKTTVLVTSTTDKQQIVFVGGDQKIDWKKVLEELNLPEPKGKQYVELGTVFTIAYFTDKHHLVGPKEQKDGVEYEHAFGEEGGDPPTLVYDTLNERLLLVGGSYTITDEGIRD